MPVLRWMLEISCTFSFVFSCLSSSCRRTESEVSFHCNCVTKAFCYRLICRNLLLCENSLPMLNLNMLLPLHSERRSWIGFGGNACQSNQWQMYQPSWKKRSMIFKVTLEILFALCKLTISESINSLDVLDQQLLWFCSQDLKNPSAVCSFTGLSSKVMTQLGDEQHCQPIFWKLMLIHITMPRCLNIRCCLTGCPRRADKR